jgi:hypothetical protein
LAGPEFEKAIDLLKFFLSDVDLVAHPTISGFMTANIETENSAITLDTTSMTFAEDTTHHDVEMTVPSSSTQTQTSIKLTNMQYHLNFATDWDVALDFTDTMNHFVNDASYSIGTFPDITESSTEHELAAETSTNYGQKISMSVVDPAPTTSVTNPTSGVTSPGTGTTSGPDGGIIPVDGALLGMILPLGIGVIAGVAVLLALVVIRKRRV